MEGGTEEGNRERENFRTRHRHSGSFATLPFSYSEYVSKWVCCRLELRKQSFITKEFGLEWDQIWQGWTRKEKKELELSSFTATCGTATGKLVIIHSLVPSLTLLWITTCTGSCAGMKNLTVFELEWNQHAFPAKSPWEGSANRWWRKPHRKPWLTPRDVRRAPLGRVFPFPRVKNFYKQPAGTWGWAGGTRDLILLKSYLFELAT